MAHSWDQLTPILGPKSWFFLGVLEIRGKAFTIEPVGWCWMMLDIYIYMYTYMYRDRGSKVQTKYDPKPRLAWQNGWRDAAARWLSSCNLRSPTAPGQSRTPHSSPDTHENWQTGTQKPACLIGNNHTYMNYDMYVCMHCIALQCIALHCIVCMYIILKINKPSFLGFVDQCVSCLWFPQNQRYPAEKVAGCMV